MLWLVDGSQGAIFLSKMATGLNKNPNIFLMNSKRNIAYFWKDTKSGGVIFSQLSLKGESYENIEISINEENFKLTESLFYINKETNEVYFATPSKGIYSEPLSATTKRSTDLKFKGRLKSKIFS